MSGAKVAVIDNYDSFTYNLVHALASAGAEPTAYRNDAVTRDELAAAEPEAIVLSPGPGHPANRRDFGVCTDLITNPLDVPMLGVCLGMQGMAHHTGGRVMAAPEVVHGESRDFHPLPSPLFDGIDTPIQVGRYHSLAVDADSLTDWEPLGSTDDGILMAMAHRSRPWYGVQFHPESILTPQGDRMIRNFLA